MIRKSELNDKSLAFALRIVNLYKHLIENKREYVMSKQLLKCGTSIGANIAEAFYGQSKLDFISKLCIAQKENGETLYWIELLYQGGFLNQNEYESIHDDALNLIRMLASSIKTARKNSK